MISCRKRDWKLSALRRLVFLGSAVLSTFALVGTASAQPLSCDSPDFVNECLPWGLTDLSSTDPSSDPPAPYLPGEIVHLSDTGRVVVGQDVDEVYWWRKDIAHKTFGLDGDEFLNWNSNALSADGAIIVGESIDVVNRPADEQLRVFRWDAENDTHILLPPGITTAIDDLYPARTNGTVMPTDRSAISADGNTIVGQGTATDGDGIQFHVAWPYRWTNGGVDGTTTDLLQEDFSELFTPTNISGDGSVVAGKVGDFSPREAAKWPPISFDANLGIPDLNGATISTATAISYDGVIIAGYRPDLFGDPIEAGFLWTAIGPINTADFTRPHSITDDGKIVTSLKKEGTTAQPWIEIGEEFVSENMGSYLSNKFGLNPNDMVYGPPTFYPYGLVSADGGVFSMTGAKWVANVRPINYVSLGDSISSGEGIPPFEPGTDSGGNRCHRSDESYPWYVRGRSSRHPLQYLGTVSGVSRGFTWDHIACSGATTVNVRDVNGASQKDNPELPQLRQGVVDEFTDLVTITIGGNDAFFGEIARYCISASINCGDDYWNPKHRGDSTVTLREWFRDYVENTVQGNLEFVYGEIRNTKAPNATVVVLEYPLLYNGTQTGCISGMNQNERQFIVEATIFLNKTIRDAAEKIGVHFVTGVADAFEDHGLCGTQEAWINAIPGFVVNGNNVVNPLTWLDTAYALHPNPTGQQAYADVVSEYISRKGIDYEYGFFESGLPKNPPPVP